MSEPDDWKLDPTPLPRRVDRSIPERGVAPSTRASTGSGWSWLTVVLGVVLLLLTYVVCAAIVGANTPDAGSGVGPPRVFFTIAAIPLLMVVAVVLGLMLGTRVVVLRPVGILMVTVVGGTWGMTAISNVSATYRSPEITSLVVAVDTQQDGTQQARLEDGHVVTLAGIPGSNRVASASTLHRPLVSYPPVHTGDLMLAGTQPDNWYVTGFRLDTGSRVCYMVWSKGWISGDRVRLAIGLEVPNRVGSYRHDGDGFDGEICLDESGAAVDVWTSGY